MIPFLLRHEMAGNRWGKQLDLKIFGQAFHIAENKSFGYAFFFGRTRLFHSQFRFPFISQFMGHIPEQLLAVVWGDRIFEKCGIRRDEGGDGGKTLEIRGKRRLSARDGGANYQQS